MISDFVELHPTATITLTQTTYLNLSVDRGNFRVDFVGKVEFRLKRNQGGKLAYYTQHPLLMEHEEPRIRLYINSRPADPQALFTDIAQGIARVSQNCRALPHYLFGWNLVGAVALAQQNIEEGSGVLLDFAPVSIVKEVIAACEKHGVTTSFLGSLELDASPLRKKFSVLFIGACYVIAQQFLVRPI
ncbi:MAG: hypothetical protein ACRYFZ_07960 [Janthinobacterium lividum]